MGTSHIFPKDYFAFHDGILFYPQALYELSADTGRDGNPFRLVLVERAVENCHGFAQRIVGEVEASMQSMIEPQRWIDDHGDEFLRRIDAEILAAGEDQLFDSGIAARRLPNRKWKIQK